MKYQLETVERLLIDHDIIPDEELVEGVWHILNRKKVNLLLDGDRGAGKTVTATALASILGARLIQVDWYLATRESLFFDERKVEAKAEELGLHRKPELTPEDIQMLLGQTVVGNIAQAFIETDRDTLLLIDEGDKSESDGSNVREGISAVRADKRALLLRVLDKREMSVLGVTIRPRRKVHIALTSNERNLFAEEFYDRMTHCPVRVPGPKRIYQIIDRRFPDTPEMLKIDLANCIYRIRMEEMFVKPSVRAVEDLLETAALMGRACLDREVLKLARGILAKKTSDRNMVNAALDDVLRYIEDNRSWEGIRIECEGDLLRNQNGAAETQWMT